MPRHSICLGCLYGSQPFCYFPIVCVQDVDNIKEMWEEKYCCRYFEPCPEPEPEPTMQPWQVILIK